MQAAQSITILPSKYWPHIRVVTHDDGLSEPKSRVCNIASPLVFAQCQVRLFAPAVVHFHHRVYIIEPVKSQQYVVDRGEWPAG